MIGWRKEIIRVVLVFGLCLSAPHAQGVETPSTEGVRSEREASISASKESAPVSSADEVSRGKSREENSALSESASKEAVGFWNVLSHGMILPEINAAGRIIGSKDLKIMLEKGDKIYIRIDKDNVTPRKEYAVLRDVKKVYHPVNGKYLGHLVQVIGTVETLAMEENKMVATITRSSNPIQRGDLIVAAESLLPTAERSSERRPSSLRGTIVETKDNRLNNGQMDIVYIDRGRKDEIAAGDYFKITHRGAQSRFQSEANLPQEKAGGLVVLFTQDQTATAQIVESNESIVGGDPIFYLPQNK